MNAKKTLVLFAIIISFAFAIINAAGLITASAASVIAAKEQKFTANLTGQSEVPRKDTSATGSFEMELSADGKISRYVLNITNIENVISAHIHQGGNNTNGPVIVTLSIPTNRSGTSNQISSKGIVFSKLFEGPLTGKYVSDLMRLISDGKAYVNVSTKQNPQGELRGQISNITAVVPEFGNLAVSAIFSLAVIAITIASSKYINNNRSIKKL